ncbi:2-C-methyl-D-erythritol 4-phosphate cytidylyltransferase [Sciscionella sediminilitoris]|uniref:2-C-methyl-D-erythritol 4-phosphate cytidylyltransferase n=1 Tax=Sciscionella sediminilitoris TaxID=1445613 RepID=UPI0004DF1E11|nr:2-C-methyl-D-erythritol 4-phosphate cytidylyltransferase [Sciscionella sp. SE31]
MSTVALVPAAGRGERLGAGMPKALVPVARVPMLSRAVRGLLASGQIDRVVVAAPPDHLRAMTELVGSSRVQVLRGGADRTDSVRLALEAAGDAERVLVHDAARAFTPASVITAVVDRLRAGARAVIPVLPVTDTVKRVEQDGRVSATVDRSDLRAVQTPQGFAAEVLRAAYEHDGGALTDDAGLVERMGVTVHTVAGHPHALKITTPFDLAIAESVLATRKAPDA